MIEDLTPVITQVLEHLDAYRADLTPRDRHNVIVDILKHAPEGGLSVRELTGILAELGWDVVQFTVNKDVNILVHSGRVKFLGKQPRKNIAGFVQKIPTYGVIDD